MSFTFNGLTSTAVTISGAVATGMTGVATTQTQVNKTTGWVATGTTIHTVTAGKTFYCLGVSVSSKGATCNWHIDTDGTAQIYGRVKADQTANQNVSGSGILFTCPATKAITLVHDEVGSNTSATIWGYEA